MIQWLITALFLFFLSDPTFGQDNYTEKYLIDERMEQCLAIDSNQTTLGMIECTQKAEGAWDAELNKYYKLLMDVLDTDSKKQLKIAQRQWLVYRSRECEFIATLYGAMEGTMLRVVAAGHRNDMVRKRELELKLYYHTIVSH